MLMVFEAFRVLHLKPVSIGPTLSLIYCLALLGLPSLFGHLLRNAQWLIPAACVAV